jgi:hypothetical protein
MPSFGLNLLPTRLRAGYDGNNPPTYNRVYKAAVNGDIPASYTNGFWIIEEADEPAIAAKFGLTPKAAAVRSRKRSAPEQPAPIAA